MRRHPIAWLQTPPLSLLAEDEPHPVTVAHADGASPFFLTCDHAGWLIPRASGSRAAGERARAPHRLGHRRSPRCPAHGRQARRDARSAALFAAGDRLQPRPPVPSSICEISEVTAVPGQLGSRPRPTARRRRRSSSPTTTHRARAGSREPRRARPTVIVAMHSFTPVFKGFARPWHVGVLYNRDRALRRASCSSSCAARPTYGRRQRALCGQTT